MTLKFWYKYVALKMVKNNTAMQEGSRLINYNLATGLKLIKTVI